MGAMIGTALVSPAIRPEGTSKTARRMRYAREMLRNACLPMLAILLAATVTAQDQPDFSGRWVLDASVAADPDVARSLTVRQPIVRTNVHGAPIAPFFRELSVERQFVTGARTDVYQIGIEGGVVGGVAPSNRGDAAGPNVSQTRFSVRWEDNRLVINSGRYSGPTREPGAYTEHTEIWQLDGAGTLMLSITDGGSGRASTTKTLTYRKN